MIDWCISRRTAHAHSVLDARLVSSSHGPTRASNARSGEEDFCQTQIHGGVIAQLSSSVPDHKRRSLSSSLSPACTSVGDHALSSTTSCSRAKQSTRTISLLP